MHQVADGVIIEERGKVFFRIIQICIFPYLVISYSVFNGLVELEE